MTMGDIDFPFVTSGGEQERTPLAGLPRMRASVRRAERPSANRAAFRCDTTSPPLVWALADHQRRETVIASVNSGVMLLLAAGLLKQRPVADDQMSSEDLRAAGCDVVPRARVVNGGDLITAAGPASGLEPLRVSGGEAARHKRARHRGGAPRLPGVPRDHCGHGWRQPDQSIASGGMTQ